MDADAVLSCTLANTSGAVTNEVFIHNDPPSFYADPDEDVQFLPQLFANYEADTNDKLIFRDSETGKLEKRSASADGTKYRRFAAAATLANGDTFRSMQIAKDVAVSFADGATVGNLGGYLDLRGGAAVGPLANAASSSSTLDFGDAVARVYVGKRADTATIGCKLAGTAGLVKGGRHAAARNDRQRDEPHRAHRGQRPRRGRFPADNRLRWLARLRSPSVPERPRLDPVPCARAARCERRGGPSRHRGRTDAERLLRFVRSRRRQSQHERRR